ncbi:hypothetical protein CK203_030196 [Vitis vinifera]|uniref:Uncharacterized protein n=1 Tax=Vitis vinifera TaxID=29760 RepID=A0A438I5L5_VITVI|nr:hypothetical protein CK203_030196 [Vitis vinifera]
MGDSEKLHAKLERVKSDLANAQKAVMDRAEALGKAEGEKKTAQAEVGRLREDVKVVEAKGRDSDKEIERLRKELEELQARFATQKELDNDYQKQVDDMFLFGYQCCMKKNNITQHIPNYHSNDKDKATDTSTQGDEVSSIVDPSTG